MRVDYEYGITIITGNLGEAMALEALSEEEKAKALGGPLGKIADDLGNALPKLPPGDWEAVSHDLAIYGRTIIVTFLIRRPR